MARELQCANQGYGDRDGTRFDIRRWSAVVLLGAFTAAILFATYTDLAWDDWYITFRASKNLALGHGLTFTVGERVYSYTSPLGTLIPALLSYLTGNSSDNLVLWLFRGLNALILGFAAVLSFGSHWSLKRSPRSSASSSRRQF
jgi:hypothetical protein